jgi:hypothetical protein
MVVLILQEQQILLAILSAKTIKGPVAKDPMQTLQK